MTKILHAAQDGRCFYCEKLVSITSATKDHLVPKSKGGSNSIMNLVMACRHCNTAKGDMSKEDFFDLIKSRKSANPDLEATR